MQDIKATLLVFRFLWCCRGESLQLADHQLVHDEFEPEGGYGKVWVSWFQEDTDLALNPLCLYGSRFDILPHFVIPVHALLIQEPHHSLSVSVLIQVPRKCSFKKNTKS